MNSLEISIKLQLEKTKKQVAFKTSLSILLNLQNVLSQHFNIARDAALDYVLQTKSSKETISNMDQIKEGEWYVLKLFADVLNDSLIINESVLKTDEAAANMNHEEAKSPIEAVLSQNLDEPNATTTSLDCYKDLKMRMTREETRDNVNE